MNHFGQLTKSKWYHFEIVLFRSSLMHVVADYLPRSCPTLLLNTIQSLIVHVCRSLCFKHIHYVCACICIHWNEVREPGANLVRHWSSPLSLSLIIERKSKIRHKPNSMMMSNQQVTTDGWPYKHDGNKSYSYTHVLNQCYHWSNE